MEHKHKHQCAICPYSTNIVQNYKQHVKCHSSEKPFKCPQCSFTTKRKDTVTQHVENIHLFKLTQCRPFPCPHPGCSYAAKRKWDLKSHSKIHSNEKSFFCSYPECHFSANQKGSLTSHCRLHTGEKPFVCQFESCSYATAKQGDLMSHSRIHTKERTYKCREPNCQYATTQSSHLKTHGLTHEPREGEERPSFPCPLCEYSAVSKIRLSSHIKSHTLEKLFKCDEPNCNFEARTKQHIKDHKLSKHTDEKPFVCSFQSCDYRCKQKSNLSTHLKTHGTERRYKCELCPFRGKTRNAVRAHLSKRHADPDLHRFSCNEPQCNSAFITKDRLNNHLLIHKREKKYSCSFSTCEYRAIRKSCVTKHEYAIHSEEKKEKCRLCDYKCKTKSNLTIHIRTHTNEKPYKCKENRNGCEYRAKNAGHIRRHEKTNHV